MSATNLLASMIAVVLFVVSHTILYSDIPPDALTDLKSGVVALMNTFLVDLLLISNNILLEMSPIAFRK